MQAKYRELREHAHEQGRAEYDQLIGCPLFRDFVVLYIAEGYKRRRQCVGSGTQTTASLRSRRLDGCGS